MNILGIDPGTTTVGFAVIKKQKGSLELLDYGTINTTPKIHISEKVLEIGEDIISLLQTFQPEVVAIEKVFFQNNSKTAIDVSQARGVIMYECMKQGITVLEYTPLQVKKAITGNGKAEKRQLQQAIKLLFQMKEIPKQDDAADAIGMAYMGALQNLQLLSK